MFDVPLSTTVPAPFARIPSVFVLLILPLITNVPPAAWVKAACVAAAPPRINGALIVLVPEVLAALIAALAPVPTLVKVNDWLADAESV